MSNSSKLAKRRKLGGPVRSLPALAMCLPVIAFLIAFNYLPIFGIVIAFKDFNYVDGILGSPWVGFENFKYFFASNDAVRVIRNTLLYNIANIALKTIMSVIVAIFLYEVTSKSLLKTYQTSIMLPNFISWVLVAYVGYTLFSNNYGILNEFLETLSMNPVNWYNEPKYWPFILILFSLWKDVGQNSLLYYASLIGIDSSLFEAADLDGASKFMKFKYIMLPHLTSLVSVLTIMAVGSIMGGDFGLFYQMPMGSSSLYGVTDIISTYILRGLQNGDMGVTAAIGLFQNIVGLVLVLSTNTIVKKINPENSMF